MYKLQPGMRVLKVRRISRDTENSSALERQAKDQDEALAAAPGVTVVGEVVDATVSGAVNLTDRASLGKWMKDPLWREWDAIIVTSLDRITRKQYHWEIFAERCDQSGKEIICLDDPGLDIHTGEGRLIAYVKASQAQAYREAISRKRKGQMEAFRRSSLWAGGTWPFGYRPMPVVHEGKQRYQLFLDPVTSTLVREAYRRIVNDGWTMGKVCKDWNERGVPTAKDHQRITTAEEKGIPGSARGSKWQSSSLGAILKKPALKGLAMHRGEPLLQNGHPVRWAEPILSDEEFDRLQEVITKLGSARTGIRGNSSPVSGLFLCPCGARLYPDISKAKRADGTYRVTEYFRCGSRILKGAACEFRATWRRDSLLPELESCFLHRTGDAEVTTRTWIPGTDNRKRIEELKQAQQNLTQVIQMTKAPGALPALAAALEENDSLLSELEEKPFQPGYWQESGTGQTYRQKWESMNGWEERGPFLHRAGFRLVPLGTVKEPVFVFLAPEDAAAAGTSSLQDEHTDFESKAYDAALVESFRIKMVALAETAQEEELTGEGHA